MNTYELPPEPHVGERARRLRCQLGLSAAAVAEQAGLSEQEIIAFERTGDCSVRTMFAIHRVISGESDLAQLFTVPKFNTLADVIEFERRRRAGQIPPVSTPPAVPRDAPADRRRAAESAAKERQPLFRAVLADKSGGMYTRAEVAQVLGISPDAVDRRRRRKQLLGVPYGTFILYPAAQFKNGKVVTGLQPILEAFGDMSPWGQLQLLVAPINGDPERSILDLLTCGVDDSRYNQLIGLVRGWAG